MNFSELETRLRLAATVATQPTSVVARVMSQIATEAPMLRASRRWRHSFLAAGIAAVGSAAAVVTLFFFLTAPASLSLADVQNAFEGQRWVHIHYDTGGIREQWIDLQTGEYFIRRDGGDAIYLNDRTNTRLWYWKETGVIERDQPTIYPHGTEPPAWTPKSAWGELVAPLARFATTQPTKAAPPVVAVEDVLNGKPAIRFDVYMNDATGERFIYSQLWADPKTRLPLRRRERLQLADREQYKKEWSTGDYDFPATGPTDLYAIGVPRDTPVHKVMSAAPPDVASILANIVRAHDQFLKNYRAVVWGPPPSDKMPLSSFDVIWRDGPWLREDDYDPGRLRKENPFRTARNVTPAMLLEWASRHEAEWKQLMTAHEDYSWESTVDTKGPKPRVHITVHNPRSLLAKNDWPDEIQWPIWESGPDFQMLPAGPEMPPNCIGITTGDDGNQRYDYYFDPRQEYVCLKQIQWGKRKKGWKKISQTTLSDLHHVGVHVVAGTRIQTYYDDPEEGIDASTQITWIDLQIVSPADYPAGIFDPKNLTTGATVVGF